MLTTIVEELRGEGFTVRGAAAFLADDLAPAGAFGARRPDQEALQNIARGGEILDALADVDVAQAVVIQAGLVLGIEAIEGTDPIDGAMRRVPRTRPRAGFGQILPKRGQDARGRLAHHWPGDNCSRGRRRLCRDRGRGRWLPACRSPRVIAAADRNRPFPMGRHPWGRSTPDPARTIFILAGEPSGDRIGAAIMAALRAHAMARSISSGSAARK